MFIIGLPVQIRAKLEADAKKKGIRVTSVLAEIGRKGTFRLLPDPTEAVHKLRAYFDQFGARYEDIFVVVLPYAPIPRDVEDELYALDELGAEIVYVKTGNDDWPTIAKNERPDTPFFNKVYYLLLAEIFITDELLPSDYFRSMAERNQNLIIAKDALDTCDQVAEHRHDFLRKAADAFFGLVDKNGNVGQRDAFFQSFGLEHAQTGGISTTLTISRDGKTIHHKTANTHLKQGDKTTRQAAARIYYHEFLVDKQYYVAILYAGPHPDDNISYEHELATHQAI